MQEVFMTTIRRPVFTTLVIALAAATLLMARPAFAGPPLVCFPFDIGSAKTLPMGPNGWHDTDRQYDVSRLLDDTVALLGPGTPVIVRMETLRRATLYAGANPTIAAALLARLQARAAARQPDVALAVFDFGYLVETYRQAASIFKNNLPSVDTIDGYGLVQKAYAFRPDAEIAFASAIIAASPKRAEFEAHRRDALAGAKTDTLLSTNIVTHLSHP
jgi:hypothetical protein